MGWARDVDLFQIALIHMDYVGADLQRLTL
jgi:hypothetical protein